MDLPIAELEISEENLTPLMQAGFRTIGDVVHFLEQSLGCGSILPLSANAVRLIGIDFHAILARLKALGCWPDVTHFADISLEEFDVSDACRKALYRAGFSTLHEMVWVLEQLIIGGPTFSGVWIRHWEEIFRTLRAMGVWPNCGRLPDRSL